MALSAFSQLKHVLFEPIVSYCFFYLVIDPRLGFSSDSPFIDGHIFCFRSALRNEFVCFPFLDVSRETSFEILTAMFDVSCETC